MFPRRLPKPSIFCEEDERLHYTVDLINRFTFRTIDAFAYGFRDRSRLLFIRDVLTERFDTARSLNDRENNKITRLTGHLNDSYEK